MDEEKFTVEICAKSNFNARLCIRLESDRFKNVERTVMWGIKKVHDMNTEIEKFVITHISTVPILKYPKL